MSSTTRSSRRRFLRDIALGSAATAFSPYLSCMAGPPARNSKGLGVALVGLGGYATYELAPALLKTQHCHLAGIVTGTPSKEKVWAEKYGIPSGNIYNYSNFDNIAKNPDIDIVYVVLPVFMHKEFTIRAAKAGKHVICEKPMALSEHECTDMIEACNNANRLLSIGYRLHFEPFTQEMMRLGQQKVYGKVIEVNSSNGFVYGGDPNAWRLKKALAGGGALMDMGVYVIQGARYTTGEEPVYVTAHEEKTHPDLFREVDETVHFELEFPSGAIAHGASSYNANWNDLKVKAETGSYELTEAFRYGGMKGSTPAGPMKFDPNVNQQALQMDDFAQCVVGKRPSRVPGEEGRKDMRIVEAIYRSIASGQREKI
jgi:predicted dehydrogenase